MTTTEQTKTKNSNFRLVADQVYCALDLTELASKDVNKALKMVKEWAEAQGLITNLRKIDSWKEILENTQNPTDFFLKEITSEEEYRKEYDRLYRYVYDNQFCLGYNDELGGSFLKISSGQEKLVPAGFEFVEKRIGGSKVFINKQMQQAEKQFSILI